MSLTGRNGKPEGGINQVVPRLPAVGLDRSLYHRNRAQQNGGLAPWHEPFSRWDIGVDKDTFAMQ